MKRLFLNFIASVAIFAALSAAPQEFFLESAWQNTVPAPSVAIWSGGNESLRGAGILGGDSPVAVTGFNLDVIVENTATGGNTAPYAQPFAAPGEGYTFYEAGLGDIGSWAYGSGSQGLPATGQFASALDGTTTFQFGPYNGSNVLFMVPNSPNGTLSLTSSAAYKSLSILAASADGGGTGTFVIHFTDGTSSPSIGFNAPDWFTSNPGAALTQFGMIECGNYGAFYTQDGNLPNLYQTAVSLAALGLNTKSIRSVTFTMPGGSGTSTNTATGVFALSGTPNVPVSSNTVFLAESAVGQMTAQFLGSPQASNSLATAQYNAFSNGESYRFTIGAGGVLVTNPAATWAIVFPGGFNPSDGTIYAAGTVGNFDTNQINQMDYALRARLRINPMDIAAAQQLLMLQEDRMLPLEWSGIEALAFADKTRLEGLTINGTNQETLAIEYAKGFFQSACAVLSTFLANPQDAALAEGGDPLLSPAVTNQVAQVLDDYLRALVQYGQASLDDFQIRNLTHFYDPTQQPQGAPLPSPTQSLLNDIDHTQSEIQMRLLLASPFQPLPFYTASLAGQVQSLLRQIGRMHDSVINGRITFVAGANGDSSSDPSLYYNEFSTSFMPIFSGQLTQNGTVSSFNVALSLARDFGNWAAQQESAALTAINNVTQLAYTYTSQEQGLEQQYDSQLVNLCGYYNYGTNGPTPDLFFAALPPGTRESSAGQIITNGTYQLRQTGAIYQEWLALEQAETNLVLASLNLSNTFATMLEKKTVADAIFNEQASLGVTILSNGQQIAGIQVQQGEVQAQNDLATAQINHDTAVSQANNSIWGYITSIALPTISAGSGGVSAEIPSPGPTLSAVMDGYGQAAAALKIGQVQANTARQLADLNAQIGKIQASEQAEMQFLNADVTMLNLSADLDGLRLQAQSQAVQIQIAAQNVDQERNKLATLLGQVSYLLQQYSRAADLTAQSPQFRSDLLTARTTAIQQANDAFVLAQQWAFLAAQCFNYEDNCSADRAQKNYFPGVLAARNASALLPILNSMSSSNALLAASCQDSVSSSYTEVSLRNQVFQHNSTQDSGTNAITFYEPTLQGGSVFTNGTASLSAWTSLLQQHVTTNVVNGVRRRTLLLEFRISIDPETANGVANNRFWSCQNFGGTIYPYSNTGVQCNGVQVNISTVGLQLSAVPGSFAVQLAQNGTSVIRSFGYGNPANFLRYFNFGYYAVNPITASWNGFTGSQGSSAFQDRSPANDDWQLSISDDYLGGPNTTLLDNLSTVTDIQLAFGVRSYTDALAAHNCTH